MNPNEALIDYFYQGFAAGNAKQMTSCYHDDITFSDPAFGTLQSKAAKEMWHMLMERSKGDITVTHTDIQAIKNKGSAQWTAVYTYGPNKRPVKNQVKAHFTFKDGKIIEHHDHFNLYKWSKQALGLSGYLLGWTPFMRSKIQEKTNSLLRTYMANHKI